MNVIYHNAVVQAVEVEECRPVVMKHELFRKGLDIIDEAIGENEV